MNNQIISKNSEWWGMSSEHGWVVLDRYIPTNRPGNEGKLVFLRCKDWHHFEEERNKWNSPNYIFSDRYIEKLTGVKLVHSKSELQELRDVFLQKKDELYAAIIKDLHESFLAQHGLKAREALKAIKEPRANVCWNCRSTVSNSVDLECSTCHWIICSYCGACGCTHNSRRAHWNTGAAK